MKFILENECSYINCEKRLLICERNYGIIKLRGENKSLCMGMEIYGDKLTTNLENIKNCNYRIK